MNNRYLVDDSLGVSEIYSSELVHIIELCIIEIKREYLSEVGLFKISAPECALNNDLVLCPVVDFDPENIAVYCVIVGILAIILGLC